MSFSVKNHYQLKTSRITHSLPLKYSGCSVKKNYVRSKRILILKKSTNTNNNNYR
jgi:hypothetical protein